MVKVEIKGSVQKMLERAFKDTIHDTREEKMKVMLRMSEKNFYVSLTTGFCLFALLLVIDVCYNEKITYLTYIGFIMCIAIWSIFAIYTIVHNHKKAKLLENDIEHACYVGYEEYFKSMDSFKFLKDDQARNACGILDYFQSFNGENKPFNLMLDLYDKKEYVTDEETNVKRAIKLSKIDLVIDKDSATMLLNIDDNGDYELSIIS